MPLSRTTWTWHFDLPPERLWPVLADTNRFNEAMAALSKAIDLSPLEPDNLTDEPDLKPLANLPAFKKLLSPAKEQP